MSSRGFDSARMRRCKRISENFRFCKPQTQVEEFAEVLFDCFLLLSSMLLVFGSFVSNNKLLSFHLSSFCVLMYFCLLLVKLPLNSDSYVKPRLLEPQLQRVGTLKPSIWKPKSFRSPTKQFSRF